MTNKMVFYKLFLCSLIGFLVFVGNSFAYDPDTCIQCRQSHMCKPPECFCCRDKMPLKTRDIPQMVFFSFDDAVNPQVANFYRQLFSPKRLNPNGCPISMTLFVSHRNTVYDLVKEFYQKGMEIASHSVTHGHMNKNTFIREARKQKENLSKRAGIPSGKITGWRSPFLEPVGDLQPSVLKNLGYEYDATLTMTKKDPKDKAITPFTLDFGWPYDCKIKPCPTKAHKGFWEVPVVSVKDYLNKYDCVYVDGCNNPPPTEGLAYKFLWDNFQKYYKTNRAPMGINMHASWFYYPDRKAAMDRFIKQLVKLDDVYIVTIKQVIEWLKNPTSLQQIKSFQPWQCNGNMTNETGSKPAGSQIQGQRSRKTFRPQSTHIGNFISNAPQPSFSVRSWQTPQIQRQQTVPTAMPAPMPPMVPNLPMVRFWWRPPGVVGREMQRQEQHQRQEMARRQRLEEERLRRIQAEQEQARLLEQKRQEELRQQEQARLFEQKRQEELRQQEQIRLQEQKRQEELRKQEQAKLIEQQRLEKLRQQEQERLLEQKRQEVIRQQEQAKLLEQKRKEELRQQKQAKLLEQQRKEQLKQKEHARLIEQQRQEELRQQEAIRLEQQRLETLRQEEQSRLLEQQRIEKLKQQEQAKLHEQQRQEELRQQEAILLEQQRLEKLRQQEQATLLEKQRQLGAVQQKKAEAERLKELQRQELERQRQFQQKHKTFENVHQNELGQKSVIPSGNLLQNEFPQMPEATNGNLHQNEFLQTSDNLLQNEFLPARDATNGKFSQNVLLPGSGSTKSNLFQNEFLQDSIATSSHLLQSEFLQEPRVTNGHLLQNEFLHGSDATNSNLLQNEFLQDASTSNSNLPQHEFLPAPVATHGNLLHHEFLARPGVTNGNFLQNEFIPAPDATHGNSFQNEFLPAPDANHGNLLQNEFLPAPNVPNGNMLQNEFLQANVNNNPARLPNIEQPLIQHGTDVLGKRPQLQEDISQHSFTQTPPPTTANNKEVLGDSFQVFISRKLDEILEFRPSERTHQLELLSMDELKALQEELRNRLVTNKKPNRQKSQTKSTQPLRLQSNSDLTIVSQPIQNEINPMNKPVLREFHVPNNVRRTKIDTLQTEQLAVNEATKIDTLQTGQSAVNEATKLDTLQTGQLAVNEATRVDTLQTEQLAVNVATIGTKEPVIEPILSENVSFISPFTKTTPATEIEQIASNESLAHNVNYTASNISSVTEQPRTPETQTLPSTTFSPTTTQTTTSDTMYPTTAEQLVVEITEFITQRTKTEKPTPKATTRTTARNMKTTTTEQPTTATETAAAEVAETMTEQAKPQLTTSAGYTTTTTQPPPPTTTTTTTTATKRTTTTTTPSPPPPSTTTPSPLPTTTTPSPPPPTTTTLKPTMSTQKAAIPVKPMWTVSEDIKVPWQRWITRTPGKRSFETTTPRDLETRRPSSRIQFFTAKDLKKTSHLIQKQFESAMPENENTLNMLDTNTKNADTGIRLRPTAFVNVPKHFDINGARGIFSGIDFDADNALSPIVIPVRTPSPKNIMQTTEERLPKHHETTTSFPTTRLAEVHVPQGRQLGNMLVDNVQMIAKDAVNFANNFIAPPGNNHQPEVSDVFQQNAESIQPPDKMWHPLPIQTDRRVPSLSECLQEINCIRPQCVCKETSAPNGFKTDTTPQIVYITVDGSLNFHTYGKMRSLFSHGRKNPNGCSIKGTVFITDTGSSYRIANVLKKDGIELAMMGVSSRPYTDSAKLKKDLIRQRKRIAASANIALDDVKGWRSPGLSPVGDELYKTLANQSLYDASLVLPANTMDKPIPWPYTLDFGWKDTCQMGICPKESHNGVWEVPSLPYDGPKNLTACEYIDACTNQPETEQETIDYLMKNFNEYYKSNRAPFAIRLKQMWFHWYYRENFSGLLKFLDKILSFGDVYVTSVSDMLEWIKSPTPLKDIKHFNKWKC